MDHTRILDYCMTFAKQGSVPLENHPHISLENNQKFA